MSIAVAATPGQFHLLRTARFVGGMLVGPNWVAMSDRRVTLQAVHQGNRREADHSQSEVEPRPLP
jgi:hypothetical protein